MLLRHCFGEERHVGKTRFLDYISNFPGIVAADIKPRRLRQSLESRIGSHKRHLHQKSLEPALVHIAGGCEVEFHITVGKMFRESLVSHLAQEEHSIFVLSFSKL